jgi:hypothetical protein
VTIARERCSERNRECESCEKGPRRSIRIATSLWAIPKDEAKTGGIVIILSQFGSSFSPHPLDMQLTVNLDVGGGHNRRLGDGA